ncbi:MAG: pseudouridine synthase [Enterococcus sp.]
MRLDKFLAQTGYGSRKEVKILIKKGHVTVDGQLIKSDKYQVDEMNTHITVDGERVVYQKYFYYLLNKPSGVVSATQDAYDRTVLDLIKREDYREDLFPVGRLDKDTEGFLLLTNDGDLAHRLLSPKKHVEKEYYAQVKGVMTIVDKEKFASGLVIDGGEQTLPAELQILTTSIEENRSEIHLVLHEGKFHQVKRMVKVVGKEVLFLKRIRMGGLYLPPNLPVGHYRELTTLELKKLSNED